MRIVVPVASMITVALAALLLAIPQAATAQGIPGVEPNMCLAGKNKCVSKKIAGLMKCRELCQKQPDKKCGALQEACEQKVMDKFDGGESPEKGCFEKLEEKGEREGAKPDLVCTTTDDTGAMEEQVDAAVAELLARLEGAPAPTCGDGSINVAGEQCDGVDLGGTTCESLNAGVGTLACDGSCHLDATGCGPPANKLVFVTSQTYAADFGAANGALDGDAICQQHADDAALGGTFMAWVGDSTTSPATRFVQSTAPYVLVDGTVIADDWAALTNAAAVPLQNPINLDEFGAAPPPSVGTALGKSDNFWTGLLADGATVTTSPPCADWSASAGTHRVRLGSTTRTDQFWSWAVSGFASGTCLGQAPLACFEQ